MSKKHKCPYTWPLKSRKAMVEYLADHDSYGGWNHPYRKWSPLSWDVKLSRCDMSGTKGEPVNREFNEAWEGHVKENGDNLWQWIVEDMQRTYTEGEWSNYPGVEQGEWKFTFAGRSGGHMLLEDWPFNRSPLKDFEGAVDWREWLENLSFATLRRLYRAVVVMDQDFAPDKVEAEFTYQMSFQRSKWEEEHAQELVDAKAAEGLEPCPAI